MRCRFEKAIFESAEGYCVFVYGTTDMSVPEPARRNFGYKDQKIHFTAVGTDLPSNASVEVELEGIWQVSKYGLQFAVDHYSEVRPQTIESIIAYLSSGCIKGIGPATAKAIVARFGLQTLDILDNAPEQLMTVKGIAEGKLAKIVETTKATRKIRDLTTYLAPFDVTKRKIEKIYEEFGDKSIEILRSDPFQLCRITGFGFLTVDAIARKTNVGLKNPLRYMGAIQYCLEEAETSGHLYLDEEDLIGKCHDLLNNDFTVEIITSDEIKAELVNAHAQKIIYNEHGRVYLTFDRFCEVFAAKCVSLMLIAAKPPEIPNVSQEIQATEQTFGQVLSPSQRGAVELCLANRISVMTGGPGVGKTTTLRALLDIYRRVYPDKEIVLAAPTGKASRRMHEQTGFPAYTLHAALGIFSDEDLKAQDPEQLSADLVIVDETSMVDMYLAYALFARLKPETQLVLVGDPDQLPSVGPGNVLRELIRSKMVPTAILDTVFRQAKNSRIALNAQAVNHDDTHLLRGDDFLVLYANNGEDAADKVMKYFLQEVELHGIESVQILSPYRKRGSTCANKLNEQIRELVNPQRPGKMELKSLGRVFREGDRVIQTKNSPDVSNGEVGVISHIYTAGDSEEVLADIRLLDGREVTYNSELMEDVELSFCISIHKSQGGEFPTVIIPLLMEHYKMLRRNLLYTAISRAKEKVILIVQPQALYTAIHKNDVDKRNTVLADRVVAYYEREVKKLAS